MLVRKICLTGEITIHFSKISLGYICALFLLQMWTSVKLWVVAWCVVFIAGFYVNVYFFVFTDVHLCFHALWPRVPGLLQCCLPGFVVCFKVLTLSFSFLCHFFFLSSPTLPISLPPHPIPFPYTTLSTPAYLIFWVLVLWSRPT